MGGACSTHERIEMYTDFSLAKAEVDGPLRRPWRVWTGKMLGSVLKSLG